MTPHIWIIERYCVETREWLPFGVSFWRTKREAAEYRLWVMQIDGPGIRLLVRKYVREER